MQLCVLRDLHCGKSSCPSEYMFAHSWLYCLSMCVYACACIMCADVFCQFPSNYPRVTHVRLDSQNCSVLQMRLYWFKPYTAACSKRSVPLPWSNETGSHWGQTYTQTHTSKHAKRPGRNKVARSRERDLDGKRHSFTCCYFQISIMAGLFWLLVLLEFTPGSLTNGDWPGSDLRSLMREGEWKGTCLLLFWVQWEELFSCNFYGLVEVKDSEILQPLPRHVAGF